MSDINRLAELGMVPPLATELRRQITAAAGSPDWANIANKPAAFPPVVATTAVVGGVLKGVAVANATDAATVITRLNDLLASLRASGAIAT